MLITKKMKKLFCLICGQYRKIEKHKILDLLEKALVLSIICRKSKNKDQQLSKEEQPTEILKILGLFENI